MEKATLEEIPKDVIPTTEKSVQSSSIWRKARSLQKLILKSQAARLLAIRQVTQLNAGKK
jgi:hypothetical protein